MGGRFTPTPGRALAILGELRIYSAAIKVSDISLRSFNRLRWIEFRNWGQMKKYRQTAARIGFGFSAFAALTWLLWPQSFEQLEPEPLFVLGTALVVWILSEFKTSEEVLFRGSSPNDVRVSRDILRLHTEEFRVLLKDHDTFQFILDDYYLLVGKFLDRYQTGRLLFQAKELGPKLQQFVEKLEKFHAYVCANTVAEKIGGKLRTGFKPLNLVSEKEYDRRYSQSRTANALATDAWNEFERLVELVRKKTPEALDDPISKLDWHEIEF